MNIPKRRLTTASCNSFSGLRIVFASTAVCFKSDWGLAEIAGSALLSLHACEKAAMDKRALLLVIFFMRCSSQMRIASLAADWLQGLRGPRKVQRCKFDKTKTNRRMAVSCPWVGNAGRGLTRNCV